MVPLAEHPRSTMVLVLGILSILGLAFLGPFAWVFGNTALRECNQGIYQAPTTLTSGRALGVVGTIFLILSVLAVMVIYLFFFALLESLRGL